MNTNQETKGRFKMKGNRMSSLPIAQFCGQAPRLSSISSGRPAAMSSAFHARAAGDPSTEALWHALTPAEQAEINTWKIPTTVVLDAEQGLGLDYSQAYTEYEIAIDDQLNVVDSESENALSVGHVDIHWLITFLDELDGRPVEKKVVYVVDMKRSEWTVLDGPDTLQLHAYGLALMALYDADAYVPGIWAAVEGTWSWGEEISASGKRVLEIGARVLAAAKNTSEQYSEGPHCTGCYGRKHCPVYMMPPEAAETSLAPFVQGGQLTSESAAKLLTLIKRAEDTIEKAKEALKTAVSRGEVKVTDGNGKIWAPVEMKGRVSLSREKVITALRTYGAREPEKYVAEFCDVQGAPYQAFRWIKEAKS